MRLVGAKNLLFSGSGLLVISKLIWWVVESLKTEVKLLDLSLNKHLKKAINSMIQDFKATLFIDELVLNEIEGNYLINKIELNIKEKK